MTVKRRYFMPLYKNLPRTHKKKPDEFVSLVDHAVQLFSKYKTIFYFIFLGLIFGGVAFVFWNEYRQNQMVMLEGKLYQSSLKNDNDEMVKIINEYSGAEAAHLAAFKLAQSLCERGDFKGARDLLLKQQGQLSSALDPLITLALARVYWQMGENDEALKILNDKQLGEKSPYENEALFVKAQILEKTGKIDEARSLFQRLAITEGIDPSIKKIAQFKSAVSAQANP